MAATDIHQDADWPFIQNGAVTLFRRRPVLDAAVEALRQVSYAVHRIDCGTEAVLMRDLAMALHWQEHFGYEPDRLNLDALNDALGSEPCEERPRLALIFEGFDSFHERYQRTALQVLDIIEARSATTCCTVSGCWPSCAPMIPTHESTDWAHVAPFGTQKSGSTSHVEADP